MLINQRSCIVGKTDSFGLDISSWLDDDDTIESFSVTNEDSLLTVGTVQYAEGIIRFLATGVTMGESEVLIEWATEDRSRSEVMRIYVNEVVLDT